jgi:hypothetical protein
MESEIEGLMTFFMALREILDALVLLLTLSW